MTGTFRRTAPRTLDGLRQIWLQPGVTPQYYPMTHTSFWVEYRIWKLNPLGYHITNVALHAANAILLWQLMSLLEIPAALLIAAIFPLHPVNVESVAWISERKNVLAFFFMLASILSYWRSVRADRAMPWTMLSFVLFACALLSKTVACSMPVVVVLLLWWKRRLSVREIVKLAPFFILGAAWAWSRLGWK